MHEEEFLPAVPRGPLVGPLVPVAATARPLDFRSGGGPFPGGGTQEPVTFRTFTESGVSTGIWPPDMSGAKAGDVVVMSGNLWLKLSVDGGKTFTDVDFTKVFAADKTYGGWAGDQVIHYVPQIDCFVLYVQSKAGAKGSANQSKNVVKVALASPADLKKFKGGKAAWWRQWDFTSDDFGITAWMDFPDLSYGDAFLYINTNTFTRTFDSAGKEQNAFAGKLFFELPLKELQAGSGFSYYYAMLTESLSYGSPTQNVRDENYWAAHVNNSTMRIYSSKGNDPNYYWRERKLKANWPMATNDANGVPDIVSSAPDSGDWISTEHRIIGATKVVNQLWFAWTAANGKSDAGGFDVPEAARPDRQVRPDAGLRVRGADAGLEPGHRLRLPEPDDELEQRGGDLAGLGRRQHRLRQPRGGHPRRLRRLVRRRKRHDEHPHESDALRRLPPRAAGAPGHALLQRVRLRRQQDVGDAAGRGRPVHLRGVRPGGDRAVAAALNGACRRDPFFRHTALAGE